MTGLLKDVKNLIYWYLLRQILPLFPMKTLYILGDTAGYLNWRFSRPLSAAMKAEMTAVLGERYASKERDAIIRRALRVMAKNRLEELLFKRLDLKRAKRFIRIDGLGKMDEALSKGNGAILVIAHFGANKLVMPALGLRGYKINQVAGKPTEWVKILGRELSTMGRKSLEMELRNEQYLPASFIYVFGSMRPAFKSLRANEIVCFAVDGGGGIKKEKVRFLRREAMVSAGPFRIAERTGATLLPAFVVRQTDNTHKVIIEDPLLIETGPRGKSGSMDALIRFMAILESYVYRYPCHYAHRLALARIVGKKDMIPFFGDYEKRQDP